MKARVKAWAQARFKTAAHYITCLQTISLCFHNSLSPPLLKEALQNIDLRNSTGEAKKKSHFLKCGAPYIAEQITYLFNLIISSGVIPVVWNSAHIVPLHKNGDKSNLDNYQPISK